MIPIRLHIDNQNDVFDDNVFVDTTVHCLPRIGEQVTYTDEQYDQFEHQINNHPNESLKESINLDDSYIVKFIRHDLELDRIRVSLGV